MRLLCLILILVSCGRPSSPVREYELEAYAQLFEREIGVSTQGISLIFVTDDTKTAGTCTTYNTGRKEIAINTKHWAPIDALARVQLIYHELGHCAMGLKHDDLLVRDSSGYSMPNSIMNAYFFGDMWYWKSYADKYKQALKNNNYLFSN